MPIYSHPLIPLCPEHYCLRRSGGPSGDVPRRSIQLCGSQKRKLPAWTTLPGVLFLDGEQPLPWAPASELGYPPQRRGQWGIHSAHCAGDCGPDWPSGGRDHGLHILVWPALCPAPHRHTETQTHRHRSTETQTRTRTHTHRHRDTHRHRHRNTDTHAYTHRHT